MGRRHGALRDFLPMAAASEGRREGGEGGEGGGVLRHRVGGGLGGGHARRGRSYSAYGPAVGIASYSGYGCLQQVWPYSEYSSLQQVRSAIGSMAPYGKYGCLQ